MTESGKELLLSSLSIFYKNHDKYLDVLKDIIEGKHQLSLRMIDWLVTIYSKNNNMVYWVNNTDDNIYYNLPEGTTTESQIQFRKINLYLDYRAQLKSFKKINFDTFRRHDRITFMLDNKSQSLETTVGQLNFFRWAFNNRVIHYAILNQKIIYDNMSKNSYKKFVKNKHKSLLSRQDIINTKCYVSFD